eukprot:204779-Chlamydomonas_euryale.AAC.2
MGWEGMQVGHSIAWRGVAGRGERSNRGRPKPTMAWRWGRLGGTPHLVEPQRLVPALPIERHARCAQAPIHTPHSCPTPFPQTCLSHSALGQAPIHTSHICPTPFPHTWLSQGALSQYCQLSATHDALKRPSIPHTFAPHPSPTPG